MGQKELSFNENPLKHVTRLADGGNLDDSLKDCYELVSRLRQKIGELHSASLNTQSNEETLEKLVQGYDKRGNHIDGVMDYVRQLMEHVTCYLGGNDGLHDLINKRYMFGVAYFGEEGPNNDIGDIEGLRFKEGDKRILTPWSSLNIREALDVIQSVAEATYAYREVRDTGTGYVTSLSKDPRASLIGWKIHPKYAEKLGIESSHPLNQHRRTIIDACCALIGYSLNQVSNWHAEQQSKPKAA